jgi:hypothetical protein
MTALSRSGSIWTIPQFVISRVLVLDSFHADINTAHTVFRESVSPNRCRLPMGHHGESCEPWVIDLSTFCQHNHVHARLPITLGGTPIAFFTSRSVVTYFWYSNTRYVCISCMMTHRTFIGCLHLLNLTTVFVYVVIFVRLLHQFHSPRSQRSLYR